MPPRTPDPILVIDDEADLRELLDISIRRMGHDVVLAGSLAEARQKLAQGRYSLVLTDMRLGDGLGIEIVRQLSAAPERIPVAVITAYGSADNAVEALKAGAFDYIAKPVSLEQLRSLVLNALGRQQRDSTEADAGGSAGADAAADRAAALLPGHSVAMQEVRRSLSRLARSMAPVVISGESGSGKERAARAIHAISARASHPFIAVNCGAIPETLMESEFFGHVKGAFTGADGERGGFFHAANGGTLLLDEVADLPLAMQVKLLRALQERRVRKIGASREDAVDVRVMCASHKDLAAMVAAGQFRQDLYYRLNVLALRMPTLRERGEDIPVLARAILDHLAVRYGDPHPKRLAPAALEQLAAYRFPGNVRELENLLERAYAFAESDQIEVADLGPLDAGAPGAGLMAPAPTMASPLPATQYAPWGAPGMWAPMPPAARPAPVIVAEPAAASQRLSQAASQPASQPAAPSTAQPEPADDATERACRGIVFPIDLPARLEVVERELILQALAQTNFNRTAAAPLLGLNLRQLRYRIQQLGIREAMDAADRGVAENAGDGAGEGTP
ncbi:sigma-54-dependent transcriptional regulator [Cupriavidus oxalaticus]|uniref:Sigma-54-dependent Fis family transcriptional regulator n=1 Tax=Cupriavidus oxalaticus TaxID=96344 RepID=A0A976GAD0_9BURK|nr:sigma-54 dependent transcriptional regulator [Cupriavidus oxalaticus]QRQ87839.1 sigma-54-dependent Fis family transcriptional regulator [Cupriavidus oxalaticus]QRQ93834.1 sigma-54-dependent Fis family transcriptional regulator [Cupriavidus oxalaticus]WQD82466.1 sigma-54 dependent transcriptional regulator [Cupriavidus oxalaticus]SPC14938.1 Type 4 fimbriae expression regulatory protein PilR [Cupriavidus oxalaticus]